MEHEAFLLTNVERSLIQTANQKRRPLYGSMELLPLCNMNCGMCYVRLSKKEMEAKGRLRTKEEWLSLAAQMQKAGVLFLLLTGGEPLLYPEFRELYLALREMGFVLTINSNGTLIDEEWADFFGKYPPRRINITLYGCDEETYANLCHYPGGFGKAKRGVRLLRERHVHVKINGSLVKANQADAPRIAQIAKELDAALHVDTYMYPATRERDRDFDDGVRLSPEEAARLRVLMMQQELSPQDFMQTAMERLYRATHMPMGERVPGRIRCGAGNNAFTINWQGEMRLCVMLSEPRVPVFDMGFEAAWEALKTQADKILLAPACSACPLRGACNVCAAKALHETGNYDGVPQYVCRYSQHMLEYLARAVQACMPEKETK
ncbi:MAG: radical SAM protein [Clostridia bacterium]|nr:radical SAM protein [Clostridia bacterium]